MSNDDHVDGREVVTYIITAITVLAVAVPEGLPLAVTLSLAFSSSRMSGRALALAVTF